MRCPPASAASAILNPFWFIFRFSYCFLFLFRRGVPRPSLSFLKPSCMATRCCRRFFLRFPTACFPVSVSKGFRVRLSRLTSTYKQHLCPEKESFGDVIATNLLVPSATHECLGDGFQVLGRKFGNGVNFKSREHRS